MAKKKMVRFNVKNVKFAMVDEETGLYKTPEDLAYANSLSLEPDYSEQPIYMDGEKMDVLIDDKGKTGELSVMNKEPEYEIACGRLIEVEEGYADIQQDNSIQHAIYYEVNARRNGVTITLKSWLYNCVSGQAAESYQQNQDSRTINPFAYPLTIMGVNIKKSTGDEDYFDEKGNTKKVTRITAYPESPGYATFGDTVPIPKMKVVI